MEFVALAILPRIRERFRDPDRQALSETLEREGEAKQKEKNAHQPEIVAPIKIEQFRDRGTVYSRMEAEGMFKNINKESMDMTSLAA